MPLKHVMAIVALLFSAFSIGQMYQLNVEVHPSDGIVEVREDRLFGGETWESSGPMATFSLPEGGYKYTVSAPHHQDYEGTFSIPENKNLAVHLDPAYVEAGTSDRVDEWIIQAGWSGQGIEFTRQLGNQFMGESSDRGYVFALVPVAVVNGSNQTDSLIFPDWKLIDQNGLTYTPQTLGDMYLDESVRLDVIDIPPGGERSGFLVFQVSESVSVLYLHFDGMRFDPKWRFDLSQ